MDDTGSKRFPLDRQDNPVFPWDHVKGEWVFPVGDDEQPLFPLNKQGVLLC